MMVVQRRMSPFRETNSLHHGLELALAHLPVGDEEARLRHQAAKEAGHRENAPHPVVDKEHLPAPVDLAGDGVADDFFGKPGNVGPRREAVARRRLDDAQVAHPGEGELQGPRNGGGREGEDVHVHPQLLELFLVGHPEAVLLVDDEQAEVLEGDIILAGAGGCR